MISPKEIKARAEKWWKPFLIACLKDEPFFPITIERIGKIRSSAVRENILQIQDQLSELYRYSKDKTGIGYRINTEKNNFRKTGEHYLPHSITFETADDYLSLLNKKKDWNEFIQNSELISREVPQLSDWMLANPESLIEYNSTWPDLLKVCKYFIQNPKPGLYLRQLPIDVHTKFIEQHETILTSLLDFLIPAAIQRSSEKQISRRYFLKFDESSVRIRILDASLLINGLSDLIVPLSDFRRLNLPCRNILITENKMNFLALPPLNSTIAIWSGGGFMISHLKEIEWMAARSILYWGDLDTHGFLILHQLRSYYPDSKSIMMDIETFNAFKGEGLTKGKSTPEIELILLSDSEKEIYHFLRHGSLRLEQEKIRQPYADAILKRLTDG